MSLTTQNLMDDGSFCQTLGSDEVAANGQKNPNNRGTLTGVRYVYVFLLEWCGGYAKYIQNIISYSFELKIFMVLRNILEMIERLNPEKLK